MDIEKAVAEIGASLKEDSSESTRTVLESIKREFSTMQSSLAAANQESKGRKDQIRELENKLEDAEFKIGKLSDTTEVTKIKQEYEDKIKELETNSTKTMEEFEKEKAQLLADREKLQSIFKDEVVSDLTAIKDHDAFERIKGKLKLPEVKDDGSFDFESYNNDDMMFTKAKLVEYRDLGLFGDALKPTRVETPKVPKTPPEDVDIVELARKDPEAAKKWLTAKRGNKPLLGMR